jgi:hypothetical protein
VLLPLSLVRVESPKPKGNNMRNRRTSVLSGRAGVGSARAKPSTTRNDSKIRRPRSAKWDRTRGHARSGLTSGVIVAVILLTAVLTWAVVDPLGFATQIHEAQQRVRECLRQEFAYFIEVVVVSFLALAKWLAERFGN